MAITLDELQGEYDIRYNSTPQLQNWYEFGDGQAKIVGDKLVGKDGGGVRWDAQFQVTEDGKITYNAVLDPAGTAPNVGLMDKMGRMTKQKQQYSGEINATKNGKGLILRTRVQQGPLTIDVQFIKKAA